MLPDGMLVPLNPGLYFDENGDMIQVCEDGDIINLMEDIHEEDSWKTYDIG